MDFRGLSGKGIPYFVVSDEHSGKTIILKNIFLNYKQRSKIIPPNSFKKEDSIVQSPL